MFDKAVLISPGGQPYYKDITEIIYIAYDHILFLIHRQYIHNIFNLGVTGA